MIVADASAVVELLIGGPRAGWIERLLTAEGQELHAPSLLDVEVLQALRRLVRMGVCGERRARASVEILQDMPVRRWLLEPFLPRIWALRENLTAYDASYVSLAEALESPLLTLDRGLAEAPGIRAHVVLPGPGGSYP